MFDKIQALELLHEKMKNKNLRKHCYAVAQVMESLAFYFKNQKSLPRRQAGKIKNTYQKEEINPGNWWIAGLLHDADYEINKDNLEKHVLTVIEWLKEREVDPQIIQAVFSHGWKYVEGCPEPQSAMDWSLYCCDELTGLIVAVALVRPDKKLSSVTVDSVLRKWNSKAFAAGVDRSQVEMCEEKLGMKLNEFIEIALSAMQSISDKLDL